MRTKEEILQKVRSHLTTGSHPGLSRVREFLALLGSPELKLRFVHVAGTNGKGSVSAMTASVLSCAGYRTGLFSSPYLASPVEYFNIDSELIGLAEFRDFMEKMLAVSDKMAVPPTEFEFFTCATIQYFYEKHCDVVVLEAGMGGAQDATNVIPSAELCFITNVGMDHEAFLGTSLADIAAEKAGIIKKNSAVAAYPSEDMVLELLRKHCEEQDTELHVADFSKLQIEGVDKRPNRIKVSYQSEQGHQYNIKLNSSACYQGRNAALVLEGLELLVKKGYHITDNDMVRGFQQFRIPARFEMLLDKPLILADGGHNPQCIEALVESLQPLTEGKHVIMLTCVMRDKKYDKMYELLNPIADEFIAVSNGTERAMRAEELALVLQKTGKPVQVGETIAKGIELAMSKLTEQDCLIITGSLYMMYEARKSVFHQIRKRK